MPLFPAGKPVDFYPRPPRGGRRVAAMLAKDDKKISIHALREEGDGSVGRHRTGYHNFYPRPPRGGRPDTAHKVNAKRAFLSTPSARRATRNLRTDVQYNAISIHALREEGDFSSALNFVPTWDISIHALREEGDPKPAINLSTSLSFLSTPSARRATAWAGFLFVRQ